MLIAAFSPIMKFMIPRSLQTCFAGHPDLSQSLGQPQLVFPSVFHLGRLSAEGPALPPSLPPLRLLELAMDLPQEARMITKGSATKKYAPSPY